jgi:hypothetical protein
MPNIVLSDFPLADNTVPEVEKVSKWFYTPSVTPNSFDVINGQLDLDNMLGSWTIEREDTQRGSLLQMDSVAGTANLDYFSDWFSGVGTAGWFFEPLVGSPTAYTDAATTDDIKDYIAIPGSIKTFYNPYERSYSLFFWNVNWTNDSTVETDLSLVRFFYRLTPTSSLETKGDLKRSVNRTIWQEATGPASHKGTDKTRFWNGHMAKILLNPGYVSVGLYVKASANIPQTRVRCRSMKVVNWHYPSGGQ